MDSINIIKKVLTDNIGVYDQALKNEPVFDDERGRYLLITIGTDHNGQSIYEIFCSIMLTIEYKIVIEFNRSEIDFKEELIAAGIASENIV